MPKEENVSTVRYFCILYLSLISGILMYIATADSNVSGLDSVVRPIVFFAVNVVASLPVLFLYSQSNGKSILPALSECSERISKVIASLYFAVLVFVTVKLTVRFDLFASSEMFPKKRMVFLSALIVLICAFLAGGSFSGLSGAAVVIAVSVTVSALAVQFFLLPEIDFLNFTPLFENGIGNSLYKNVQSSLFAVECGTLPLFFGNIKGNVKRGYYISLGAASLLFLFIMFNVVGTLGLFAGTQIFPSFTAATLAKFGLFERLDSIETAVWISCVIVKLTYFIKSASICCTHIFKKLPIMAAALLIGGVAAVSVVAFSADITCQKIFASNFQNFVTYVLTVTVLPLVSLIILKISKRRQK